MLTNRFANDNDDPYGYPSVHVQLDHTYDIYIPSRHKTLNECWLNVGPASTFSGRLYFTQYTSFPLKTQHRNHVYKAIDIFMENNDRFNYYTCIHI